MTALTPAAVAVGRDADPVGELRAAALGDGDRAHAGPALDPAALEEPGRDRGAERSGDVWPALAPVDAHARERPAARPQLLHADPQLPEGPHTARGHGPPAVG